MEKQTFGEFIKTAQEKLGETVVNSVPVDVANAAYDLYKGTTNEKLASILDPMYEEVQDGYDRVGLDMIGASLLKEAGLAGGLLAAGKAFTKAHPNITGMVAWGVGPAVAGDAYEWGKNKLTRKKNRPQTELHT